MKCDKCGHMPSERIYTSLELFECRKCDCPCHTVADAGPELLAACKAALPHFIELKRYRELREGAKFTEDFVEAEKRLKAAIALAERKGSAS